MSLQVWLPLTKDLRNQGLSNMTVTNSGATYSSTGGKLGGCYSFDGTDDAIGVGNLSTIVDTDFSWSCWFYRGEWSSKSWETIFGGPSGFELETKSGSTNSPLMYAYSWGKGTFTYELNQWNHLVMTRTTSETKFYLNGELKLTGNAGSIPSGNYFVGSWSSTTGQNFKGKVNDVRIYDHCLSPMEVKWLSQGLVLHYPLNDKNIEPTTNLNTKINMNNSTNSVWGGHSTTTTTYDCTNEPVPFNSGNKIEITYPVGGNTGGGTSVNLGVNIPVSSSTTYTLSTYLKASDNFNYWTANFLYYYGDTAGHGIFNINNKEYIADGWYRIWGTLTTGSSQTTLNPYFYSYPSGNRTYYIGGWQLEQKNHMTPFVSPGGSRNNSIIYDCSGFCNNGEKIGTLTYTNDTPKYAVSTHIGATSQKIHVSNFPTSGFGNSYSFAWWGKRTSNNPMFWGFSDGIRLNGMYVGTLWNTGDGGNNPLYKIGTTTQVTAPSVNVWHHYVMTGNGTKCYVYLDGELWAEAKTYKAISGTSIYINGWSSATDYCSDNTDMSDFRIYATALSADDVKSLYQNCATIDPDGTIRGQIRS